MKFLMVDDAGRESQVTMERMQEIYREYWRMKQVGKHCAAMWCDKQCFRMGGHKGNHEVLLGDGRTFSWADSVPMGDRELDELNRQLAKENDQLRRVVLDAGVDIRECRETIRRLREELAEARKMQAVTDEMRNSPRNSELAAR